MSAHPSSKQPGGYEHRFHAGNAADVYKHVALVMLLDRIGAAGGMTTYVETHAGSGRYHLGPEGEWRDGIGRLLSVVDDSAPAEVRRYLALLDARPSKKGVRYLGSPLLAARALTKNDAAEPSTETVLYEIDDEAAGHLRAAVEQHGNTRVVVEDGVAALGAGLPAVDADRSLVALIDPPWVEKAEWTRVPDALVEAAGRRPLASFALWYPVKSLTRPNAMMQRLSSHGLQAVVVELSTSPTAVSKGRLVGSGLVLVRPPAGFVEDLARVASWLGPRLATTKDAWSLRVTSWTAEPAGPR